MTEGGIGGNSVILVPLIDERFLIRWWEGDIVMWEGEEEPTLEGSSLRKELDDCDCLSPRESESLR